jgi:hypothetical protein
LKAEEFVCDNSGASSFEVDRDATAIEPLVSGQQFIALPCAGSGIANCVNSPGVAFADADRFAPFRFAWQHACASIAPDICGIAWAAAAARESISAIAPFA